MSKITLKYHLNKMKKSKDVFEFVQNYLFFVQQNVRAVNHAWRSMY